MGGTFTMFNLKNTLLSLMVSVSWTGLQADQFNPWLFNVYSLGNINYSGSDFQGIAGSGGNATFSGFSLNENNVGPGTSYSLYSGGNVTFGSGSVFNGGIEAGGSVSLNSTTVNGPIHSGGNLSGNSGMINGNVNLGGTNQAGQGLVINGTVQQNQSFTPSTSLQQYSNFFQSTNSSLGSQSATAGVNSVYGQLVVDPLHSGLNIISLTLAQINASYGIALTGPADATTVINVTGANTQNSQFMNSLTLSLNGGISASDILFNIVGVSNLLLNGGQYINILAPDSNVNFTSGLVTGNLIAGNLTGSGQVNQGSFVGVAAPEPGTYLILGSLVGAALVLGRRRQQKKA